MHKETLSRSPLAFQGENFAADTGDSAFMEGGRTIQSSLPEHRYTAQVSGVSRRNRMA